MPRRPAAALLCLLLLPAASVVAQAPSVPSPAEARRLEAIVREREAAARANWTPADAAFMTGMIAHHAQALEMAALADSNGASPAVRVLAARIINAQLDEIATMRTWLQDRGQPVPEVPAGAHAHHHGPGHAGMPGMATPAQLAELRAARGAAFDRRFLELMIAHHKGAVAMVTTLFATDGAGQDEGSFRLATDINVDQITEVRRMEQMLRALPQP